MILSLNGIIAVKGSSSLLTNLVSVYKAESNANDSFGTNNGTAQGGLTYTTGKSGNAFNLNGTNAYVSLPNNSLNLTGDFSYSAWVYFRNVPSGERFIVTATNGNGTNVNLGVSFGIVSGQLSLGVYANTDLSSWKSNGTLLPSTWYHVMVTKKLSNAPKFYINGTLQTTSLLAGINTLNPIYTSGTYPNSLTTIGAYRYNNGSSIYGYSNANIDELNAWQKELTPAEITELYNSGSGKFYPYVSLPTLDLDAQAFISAATITDSTQQSAVNQLVLDLKIANIWTKMKAIYPFVGGTATSHKWNLKDPRDLDVAFRLSFIGGGTHSSTGYLPNGTTAYADTFLAPQATLSQDSTHISYYSRTDNNIGFEMGARYPNTNPSMAYLAVRAGGNTVSRLNNIGVESSVVNSDGRGFYMLSRTSSGEYASFKNTTKTTISQSSQSIPTQSITIGAYYENAWYFGSKESAFASIGDGLTDGEATALHNAVQTFNTTLSRNY